MMQIQNNQRVFLNDDENSKIILVLEFRPGLKIPADKSYKDYINVQFQGLDPITNYTISTSSTDINKTSLTIELPPLS